MYEADWDGQGKKAGVLRNQRMALIASRYNNNGCILFWDGESKETQNMMKTAYEYGISVRCYNYIKQKWISSADIEAMVRIMEETGKYYV